MGKKGAEQNFRRSVEKSSVVLVMLNFFEVVAAGECLSLNVVDELKRAGVQRIEVLLN